LVELSGERVLVMAGGDRRAGSVGAHAGDHTERQGS
jgi:hypothetical protein